MDDGHPLDAFYRALKAGAREITAQKMMCRFRTQGGVDLWKGTELATLNDETLNFIARNYKNFSCARRDYGTPIDWLHLWYSFRRQPSFFDIAVWQNIDGEKHLQGFALGRTSNSKRILNLHYVERSMEPTYFKGGVLLPILTCAEEYARCVARNKGHSSVWISVKEPNDPSVYRAYMYGPSGPDGQDRTAVWKEITL